MEGGKNRIAKDVSFMKVRAGTFPPMPPSTLWLCRVGQWLRQERVSSVTAQGSKQQIATGQGALEAVTALSSEQALAPENSDAASLSLDQSCQLGS